MTAIREIFVHLVYLDDSGTDGNSSVALCGAVIVQPENFMLLENLHGSAMKVLPQEVWLNFQEFKGCELYQGIGAFKGVGEEERFKIIHTLLTAVMMEKLPFIYFAVDKQMLAKSPMGSANPLDVAFRMCALGIESWAQSMHDHAPGTIQLNFKDFFLCVMDDTDDKNLKQQLRSSYRNFRSKMQYNFSNPHNRLWHAHDDLYFGDSKESVGLQMADLCSYFVRRHLIGREDEQGFYKMFSAQVICAKTEPEWSIMKDMAKIHVPEPSR